MSVINRGSASRLARHKLLVIFGMTTTTPMIVPFVVMVLSLLMPPIAAQQVAVGGLSTTTAFTCAIEDGGVVIQHVHTLMRMLFRTGFSLPIGHRHACMLHRYHVGVI
jgi:hypothetical protein